MAEKQFSVPADDNDISIEDAEEDDASEDNTTCDGIPSVPVAEPAPEEPAYTIPVTQEQLKWLDSNLTVRGFKASKKLFNKRFQASYSVSDLRKICKEHKIKIRSADQWNKADRTLFNSLHRKEINAYLDAHADEPLSNAFVAAFNAHFGVLYPKTVIKNLRYNRKRQPDSAKALAESFFGKPVEDISWEEDGQKLLNKLQKDKSDMEAIVNAQPAYAYEK